MQRNSEGKKINVQEQAVDKPRVTRRKKNMTQEETDALNAYNRDNYYNWTQEQIDARNARARRDYAKKKRKLINGNVDNQLPKRQRVNPSSDEAALECGTNPSSQSYPDATQSIAILPNQQFNLSARSYCIGNNKLTFWNSRSLGNMESQLAMSANQPVVPQSSLDYHSSWVITPPTETPSGQQASAIMPQTNAAELQQEQQPQDQVANVWGDDDDLYQKLFGTQINSQTLFSEDDFTSNTNTNSQNSVVDFFNDDDSWLNLELPEPKFNGLF
jgi:hypothetical protein